MRVEQTPIPEQQPKKTPTKSPGGEKLDSFLSLLTQKQRLETEQPEASPEELSLLAAALLIPEVNLPPEAAPEHTGEMGPVLFSTVPETAVEKQTVPGMAETTLPEDRAAESAAPEAVPAETVQAAKVLPQSEIPAAAAPKTQETPRQSLPEEGPDLPRESSQHTRKQDPEIRLTEGETPQPLFRETAVMPRRVGNAAPEKARTPEVAEQLKIPLRTALKQGQTRLEVQLTPEHLGKVTVELTREETGELHVLLRTEHRETGLLLREHAHELGQLLESSRREPVQVEVRQEEPDRQTPQEDSHGRHNRQQEQRRQPRNSGEDFLQQLRLGLVSAG